MRVTILTPDYKLDQTLVADSSLALDELSIDFKFHRVDESARFAQITITGIKFDFYYFPRASQICIDGDTLGVIVANVPYGTDVTIVFDGTEVTIGGNSFGYQSSKTVCDGAAYLGVGSFQNTVVEAKIGTA